MTTYVSLADVKSRDNAGEMWRITFCFLFVAYGEKKLDASKFS